MMIAMAEYPDRFAKLNTGEHEWIDDHSTRVPWLNFLTSQSIPEETDVVDYSKQKFSDDDCSFSSMEDSYIVLDIQPRQTVEMNFGEINQDDHCVEYDQLAQSMVNEIPSKEQAVQQLLGILENRVEVSADVLCCASRETDDQYSNIERVRANHQMNEYESSPILPPLPKQSLATVTSMKDNPPTNSLARPSINPIGLLHTSQQKSNLSRIHPEKQMLAGAFALDKQVQKPTNSSVETNSKEQKLKITANSSKTSALIRLIQRPVRMLNHSSSKADEPSLLRINYLDGRPALINVHPKCSSLSKISFTQDFSHRQRILNHLQRLIKPITTDQSKKRATLETSNRKKKLN